MTSQATILLVLIAACTVHTQAQEKLDAYIEPKADTLYSDDQPEVIKTAKIFIPKQQKFKIVRFSFELIDNVAKPKDSEVFLQPSRLVAFGKNDTTIAFDIRVRRNEKDDRILQLKLKAEDESGNSITLKDENKTTYALYIKPLSPALIDTADSKLYEFLLFTGTNLDFLDGIRAKDLYFNSSYLFNLQPGKPDPKKWAFITFGKNRYFSTKDSVTRLPFRQEVFPRSVDSINIANGLYNVNRERITENTHLSLDLLFDICGSTTSSKFFFSVGFNVGLSSIRFRNTGHHIVYADTSRAPLSRDTTYRFQPMRDELKTRETNGSVNVGLFHILSTSDVNVKSQFKVGLNNFAYPKQIRNGAFQDYMTFENDRKLYYLLRVDATVIKPGISLGFETFHRMGYEPMFNVSLTKAFHIKQLASLFTPLSTMK